jgi:hypothetical protein
MLVGVLLALVFFSLCAFVLNGIVRHLDRLPSVEQFSQPKFVDHRALKACALDIKKLEKRIRDQAAKLFTNDAIDPHESTWQSLEERRLEIVARCKLNRSGTHPAHASLLTAIENIESQIRAFHLLYDKHQRESVEYSMQAQRAVRDALIQLTVKK